MNKIGSFLPKVEVTTIIWTDLNSCRWEAAQGDDLKLMQPTIELNLYKLAQRGEIEAVAKGMVEQWLGIHTVLATRQDLINKEVRGEVDNEDILCETNYKVILESKSLRRKYADLTIGEILNGRWVVDIDHAELTEKIKALLTDWQRMSEELDNHQDNCYLCGKRLLPDEATPNEWLEFTVNTPYTLIKPTPFITALVWICPDCKPLAKEMGIEAEPFEIKTRELKKDK